MVAGALSHLHDEGTKTTKRTKIVFTQSPFVISVVSVFFVMEEVTISSRSLRNRGAWTSRRSNRSLELSERDLPLSFA